MGIRKDSEFRVDFGWLRLCWKTTFASLVPRGTLVLLRVRLSPMKALDVYLPLLKADWGAGPGGKGGKGGPAAGASSGSSSSDRELNAPEIAVAEIADSEIAEAPAARASSPAPERPRQMGKYGCHHEGCKKWAMYGPENSTQKLFCGEHKVLGYVSGNTVDACDVSGCRGFGWFRSPTNGKRTRRCEIHREPGLVPMQRRTCEVFGCKKKPVFGFETIGTARFCEDHPLVGTVRIRRKYAAVPVQHQDEKLPHASGPSDPGTVPSPAPSAVLPKLPPTEPPSNPKRHDRGKPVSRSTRRKHDCRHKSCTTQAAYNFEGGPRSGLMCAKHRLLGMVDIGSFCASKGCLNYGWFRAPQWTKTGDKRGHCEEHREPGERPIKRQKCEAVDCRGDPEYGKSIGGIGRFCSKHRLDGYVKVHE